MLEEEAPHRSHPGWGALALAWMAAVAVLVVPMPAPSLLTCSRLAASALPFLALAGLPGASARGTGSNATGSALGAALLWAAAAIGPLSVAARLDQLDGRTLPRLAVALPAVLIATMLLAFSATRARGRGWYALAWSASVLLPAMLGGVLYLFADAEAAALCHPAWSPIGWAWSCASDLDRATAAAALAPPLLVCTLLCVSAAWTRERGR